MLCNINIWSRWISHMMYSDDDHPSRTRIGMDIMIELEHYSGNLNVNLKGGNLNGQPELEQDSETFFRVRVCGRTPPAAPRRGRLS